MAATLGVENSDKTNNWKNDSDLNFSDIMFENFTKNVWKNKIELIQKALDFMEFIYERLVNHLQLFQSDEYFKKMQLFSDVMKTNWRKIKIYQDTYQSNIENNNL